AGTALIVLGEDEEGKSGPHQRNRAVSQLRGAHRFGVQAAGLLELECRLLRDRKSRATADHVEIRRVGETREGRAPVELPGAREELGGALEGRSELRIARPERDELYDRRERGDVGLGRGHTLLDPGAERD